MSKTYTIKLAVDEDGESQTQILKLAADMDGGSKTNTIRIVRIIGNGTVAYGYFDGYFDSWFLPAIYTTMVLELEE
jgi:hypothetical protein